MRRSARRRRGRQKPARAATGKVWGKRVAGQGQTREGLARGDPRLHGPLRAKDVAQRRAEAQKHEQDPRRGQEQEHRSRLLLGLARLLGQPGREDEAHGQHDTAHRRQHAQAEEEGGSGARFEPVAHPLQGREGEGHGEGKAGGARPEEGEGETETEQGEGHSSLLREARTFSWTSRCSSGRSA